MKICLQCKKEHDGLFGSGKYCCRSCSNSRKNIKGFKTTNCTICKDKITINKHTDPKKATCSRCKKKKR